GNYEAIGMPGAPSRHFFLCEEEISCEAPVWVRVSEVRPSFGEGYIRRSIHHAMIDEAIKRMKDSFEDVTS
ncbi:hypothetical protein HAX54_012551, partial [Datura stramonium]|nr:hypothetical protein [Datura stramonium]